MIRMNTISQQCSGSLGLQASTQRVSLSLDFIFDRTRRTFKKGGYFPHHKQRAALSMAARLNTVRRTAVRRGETPFFRFDRSRGAASYIAPFNSHRCLRYSTSAWCHLTSGRRGGTFPPCATCTGVPSRKSSTSTFVAFWGLALHPVPSLRLILICLCPLILHQANWTS